MAANNSVNIIGRFTKDPELQKTTSGLSVVNFTLAVDRASKDKGCNFINCTAYQKNAENICLYCAKGKLIAVEGSVEVQSYKDNSGNNRSKLFVNVVSAKFLQGRDDQAQSATQATAYNQSAYSNQNHITQVEYPSEDVYVNPDDLPF